MKAKLAFAITLLLAAGCGKKEDPIIQKRPLSEWLERLADNEPVTRRGAAVVLGTAGAQADQVVGPLVNALDDTDAAVRVRAAEALGKIGAPAVKPLTNLLADSNQRLRVMAAIALARADPSNDKAVSILIEAALVKFEPGPRGENLPSVEKMAEESLQGIGAKAVPGLIQAIKHENANLRILAGRTIIAMGPEVAKDAGPALEAALKDKYEPLQTLAATHIHRWRADGRREEMKAHK
jgi:HEAT repeat protein